MERRFLPALAAIVALAPGTAAAQVAAPPPLVRADTSTAVYFEHNRSRFGPSAPEVVAQSARLILMRPFRRIVVAGHADGSESDPRGLSRRRAEAVVRALVAHGVDPARIELHAAGSGLPEPGTTGRGRESVNRRVAIHIFRSG